MLTFQDVLEREGLAARDVNVMLHSPKDPRLQAILPSLPRTNPAAMLAYQSVHSAPAERALSQGRSDVASFAKTGRGQEAGSSDLLFLGLYANPGSRQRPRTELASDAEIIWLRDSFGEFQELDDLSWTHRTWFDLARHDALDAYRGRLVISTRLTPNYVRRAENLDAPIRAIHLESAFDAAPPDWRGWVLSAAELRALPPGWAARLREWRGIYLIRDRSDGACYVGSAYGKTNLLGRWQDHVAGDAGVTVELAQRDPAGFDFSILERVSPDMEIGDITTREQGWMTRLHTKVDGLNR